MADSPDDDPESSEPQSMADILLNLPAVRAAKKVNTLSRVHRRLIEPITDDDSAAALAFQHSVFCQIGLPYKNPGDDVRLWKRTQGAAKLEVQAGRVLSPAIDDFVDIGLPWGAKPRLILAHLNAEALRQGSPLVEVESSLSAFVKRIRGFDGGREIRFFKDQLTRLSASLVRLAVARDDQRAHQVESKIIAAFDLWLEKDERQRVMWPSTIQLSHEYFVSLQAHAVPLYEADLAALAHSALALDLYCWLAQRLHRITPTRPAFVTWAALKQQFGPDYGRMDNFKRFFRKALRQVHARYDRARFDLDGHGITLHHSLPPVTKRQVLLLSKSTT
jgi:Plasmid encoded RepA protein